MLARSWGLVLLRTLLFRPVPVDRLALRTDPWPLVHPRHPLVSATTSVARELHVADSQCLCLLSHTYCVAYTTPARSYRQGTLGARGAGRWVPPNLAEREKGKDPPPRITWKLEPALRSSNRPYCPAATWGPPSA